MFYETSLRLKKVFFHYKEHSFHIVSVTRVLCKRLKLELLFVLWILLKWIKVLFANFANIFFKAHESLISISFLLIIKVLLSCWFVMVNGHQFLSKIGLDFRKFRHALFQTLACFHNVSFQFYNISAEILLLESILVKPSSLGLDFFKEK